MTGSTEQERRRLPLRQCFSKCVFELASKNLESFTGSCPVRLSSISTCYKIYGVNLIWAKKWRNHSSRHETESNNNDFKRKIVEGHQSRIWRLLSLVILLLECKK